MKYMGSKNRYAKYIIPFLENGRRRNQYVVDIFCGGCNLIDKVSGLRIANDIHPQLIALMKAIQTGWIPPTYISEEQYQEARDFPERFKDYEVGFIGFAASYSGKWFGGYARGKDQKGNPRNYVAETARNLIKQSDGLRSVKFRCVDYRNLGIPKNSIIYADPPYAGTTEYSYPFDHDAFWEWVREKCSEGHKCYISENSAPEDFECVWEQSRSSSMPIRGTKKSIERLFTIKR